MADRITIIVKADGAEPVVLEDLAGFSLVAIPYKDPDKDTSYYGNLDPETLGRVGMWLISLAKSFIDKTDPPPLSSALSAEQERALKLKRSAQNSNLILPGGYNGFRK